MASTRLLSGLPACLPLLILVVLVPLAAHGVDGAAVRVTMGADGYFRRDGDLFVPVGVNYWPASTGVHMWQEFDATVRTRGMRGYCVCVRLKLIDFERLWLFPSCPILNHPRCVIVAQAA